MSRSDRDQGEGFHLMAKSATGATASDQGEGFPQLIVTTTP
jgi:hypothetical protein